MRITCDLCGGELQVNPGGKGAACTVCGLGYTMERLREKLSGQSGQKQNLPKPEPEEEIVYDVQDWSVIPPAPDPHPRFDFVPQQFVMENNGGGIGDISGRVQQGGIGLGDSVYINGDYAHPYRVYSINDDPYTTCAKEGMPAELALMKWPGRKILKNARIVYGDPNPVANAYNYPGTVREYFTDLLCSEFSQYEIHTDVSRDELSIPISFLLCQGSKPVTAVFLINSNDGKARRQVEKAARIFAPEGVSCTHFFENYRNDMPYVIQRVRGALG